MGKIIIDFLGGKLEVPNPIGDCWHCKHYVPRTKCRRGCNILNGMKFFESK